MGERIYKVNDYGAAPDGKMVCTKAIQKAVDDASVLGGCVTFEKGAYLTGSIFLKSNVEFKIDSGVEILGAVDENAYPYIWSRVAGIEMYWPAGLINVLNSDNVKITGTGTINGQGEYWWNKYWGVDKKGGMRKIYDAKGIRWAADYDCKRPRNVIVFNSSNVLLQGVKIIRSPFWNVHVCYSQQVNIHGVSISDNKGPSTDGIDIDSSNNVIVQNCYIECSDDNICLKAGRDYDGLRVNRPTENVIIRDCETGLGEGITIGSETSGGIYNVDIYNIKEKKTKNGFRLKSARTRGGTIENIHVNSVEMQDVSNPFSFELNWNPSYSYCKIPENYKGGIPTYWKALSKHVQPPERGIPIFRDIKISNVKADNAILAFEVDGYIEKPMRDVRFENVKIDCMRAGYVNYGENWQMNDVILNTQDKKPLKLNNCINVQLPEIR